MAVGNTGGQDFGIQEKVAGFITESFSITNPAETVELKDGNGLSIGLAIIPGRTTISATVQAGTNGVAPSQGDLITIDGTDYNLTEVVENQSQGDYRRFSLSGVANAADPDGQTP
jgi:hypothetical protein